MSGHRLDRWGSVDVLDHHSVRNAVVEVGLMAGGTRVESYPDSMGLVRSGLLQNRLDGVDEPLAFVCEKLFVTGWKLAHSNRIDLQHR
jgi:hypothetical protein